MRTQPIYWAMLVGMAILLMGQGRQQYLIIRALVAQQRFVAAKIGLEMFSLKWSLHAGNICAIT